MKRPFQSDVAIRELDRPGDRGWVVAAHGEQYAREFGWTTEFEALVARIVGGFTPSDRERAWIAEVGGERVGCVFCVAGENGAAVLRILLVLPAGRGRGIGGALVDTCIAFAREAGYDRMRLWTNHPLAAARELYLARGFVLVGEERHRSFGADLVGQTYELSLSTVSDGRSPATSSASASASSPGG